SCTLPPLRERADGIPDMLRSFTAAAAMRMGRPAPAIDASAVEAALAHGWPGNIREMINRVDRAVALGNGSTLLERDLFPDGISEPAGSLDMGPASGTLSDIREAAERRHIVAALARTGNSPKEAADLLGVSRTTLWEKMRRYGIEADD
ncbi:helix-turn-helix domain-containing protein, partial [Xanthomonas perforans]|uniref:helix-turn-helix domain-containing protein n=1 Tax=Xanthomonas perforans TaxID=442694 RepID=UPI0019D0EDA0